MNVGPWLDSMTSEGFPSLSDSGILLQSMMQEQVLQSSHSTEAL